MTVQADLCRNWSETPKTEFLASWFMWFNVPISNSLVRPTTSLQSLVLTIIAAKRENQSSGFPTRSDTNQAVQSQKKARCLKFRIYVEEELYYAKTKVLISFAVTAKLICTFVFAQAKIQFSHDTAHYQGDLSWHAQVHNQVQWGLISNLLIQSLTHYQQGHNTPLIKI